MKAILDKQKIIQWIKKSWVFLVAGAVVLISTIMLAASINRLHNKNKVFLEDEVFEPISFAGGEHIVEREDLGDDFVMPVFLVSFDETADRPTAKDIPLRDAADIAAIKLIQLFGAKLDGEVCEGIYSESHVHTESAGNWTFHFGNDTPGELRYTVLLNSISGETSYIRRYHHADSKKGEDAVPPEDYEMFRQNAIDEAKDLTEKYLLDGAAVLDIKASNIEKDERKAERWESTKWGHAPEVYVLFTLNNGKELQFVYSAHKGFLEEIYFNYLEATIFPAEQTGAESMGGGVREELSAQVESEG